jgi:hypothetical protein
MAAAVKVVLISSGVQALLKSAGVQAEAKRRVDPVAAQANAASTGTFEASVVVGAKRAHASVITADFQAMLDESQSLVLTSAIDAAR